MKPGLPKGTQDFLPSVAVPRQIVLAHLAQVFERYGFDRLETPAFERLDILQGKYGDEGDKLLFKLLKRGEAESRGETDLALRYDLTVPLARVVAMYEELPRPFKRYQMAPVWRAERPQRGRFREFTQCDVDVAGSSSPLVEVEILSLAHEVYQALGFADFVMQLNHRQVLRGLVLAGGVPPEQEVPTLIVLDKLDKIGAQGVLGELAGRGFTASQLEHFQRLLALSGDNESLLAAMADLVGEHAPARAGLQNLRTILDGVRNAGVPEARVQVMPVLARGLSYYTGAIYEVNVPGFASSIGGGGRYDELVGMFSGRQVPACGISFGLDRILLLMQEGGRLAAGTRTQVLIPLFDAQTSTRAAPAKLAGEEADPPQRPPRHADSPSSRSDGPRAPAEGVLLPQKPSRDATISDVSSTGPSLALAAELRAAGLRVDVYPDPGPLGRQLQYGSARGIPFAAILGPDELAKGEVLVRDLRSRQQQRFARGDVARGLQAMLEAAAAGG